MDSVDLICQKGFDPILILFKRLTPMDALPNVDTCPLLFTVGLTFGRVKKIKSE